jgi:hypothetical protein
VIELLKRENTETYEKLIIEEQWVVVKVRAVGGVENEW